MPDALPYRVLGTDAAAEADLVARVVSSEPPAPDLYAGQPRTAFATTMPVASSTVRPWSGVALTARIRFSMIPTCLTASSRDSGSITRPFAITMS